MTGTENRVAGEEEERRAGSVGEELETSLLVHSVCIQSMAAVDLQAGRDRMRDAMKSLL